MADRKKRIAVGILDFLQASIDDGTIKSDDKESIDVAIQCISEAFSIDSLSSSQRASYSLKPASLDAIVDVYLKTQSARSAASSSSSAASPAAAAAAAAAQPSTPTTSTPSASAADKAAAEQFKADGNKAMAAKKYQEAIDLYGKAIAKDAANPVYYSNRAAAYSQIDSHDLAIADAQKAAEVDPKFTKAYSRLGHALFSSGRYSESVTAYESGLALDPSNAIMKSSLATAREKAAAAGQGTSGGDDAEDDAEDDVLAPGAGARGGPGGMPNFGGGGMPDLASLMNNPAMMNMAQQMMANGGMERMMQNPMIQNMMRNMGGGGGMPDLSAMMNDPEIRNMANQLRGMGGGAGGL